MSSIELNDYYNLKAGFFSRHSYRDGDYVLAVPKRIIVKYTNIGLPTECHLSPYGAGLGQSQCIALVEVLRRISVMPPVRLKAVRYMTEEGEGKLRFLYARTPGSLEEAVTLLEDLPFNVEYGILQSLYAPPERELADGSRIMLPFTATIYGDTKYPTIIMYMDPEPYSRLNRVIAEEWGELVSSGRPPKPEDARWRRTAEWRRLASAVSSRLERMRGEMVAFMVANTSPPVALLPVFP